MMETNADRLEKNDNEVEEKGNLGHAQNLWAGLRASESHPQLRVIHLWRIIHLAELARLAPILSNKKGVTCGDCLSMGFSSDGQKRTGASSKVRTKMRKNLFEKELKNISESIKHTRHFKCLKDVWAPEGEGAFGNEKIPKLKEVLEKEFKEIGQSMPDEPDSNHKYESCAEPVVYQKLSLTGDAPEFLYVVQKTVGNENAQLGVLKHVIKVVHRCKNCLLAGNHLGQVITDHEKLVGLQVAIVTPRVMRFFREVTETEQALKHEFANVWLQLGNFGSLKWEDKVLLPKSGNGGTRFDQEIAIAERKRNTIPNRS